MRRPSRYQEPPEEAEDERQLVEAFVRLCGVEAARTQRRSRRALFSSTARGPSGDALVLPLVHSSRGRRQHSDAAKISQNGPRLRRCKNQPERSSSRRARSTPRLPRGYAADGSQHRRGVPRRYSVESVVVPAGRAPKRTAREPRALRRARPGRVRRRSAAVARGGVRARVR